MNTPTRIVGLTGFFALLLALPIIVVIQSNKVSTQSQAAGINPNTTIKSTVQSRADASTAAIQTIPTKQTTRSMNTQNALDINSAGLEGSNRQWENWYSTTISNCASTAHSETNCFQVNITANNGWGLHLINMQGFAATPGRKTISFWGLKGAGATEVTMEVTWMNASNKLLQTNQIALPSLTTVWQQASSTVNAPAGTTHANINFIGNSSKGTIFYLDNIFVSK